MPAPAGAITVLLPLYLDGLQLFDVRSMHLAISIYTLCMAGLLVSTLPTFSGKLLGERISREWVMPILVGVTGVVGLLVTYPYATMTVVVLTYLGLIPFSMHRYRRHQRADDAEATRAARPHPGEPPRIVEIRPDTAKR